MNSIERRLSKLEGKFGMAGNSPKYILVLSDGRDLGPAEDAYIQILSEQFPDDGSFGIVDFEGVSREEVERFVRENG